MGFFYSVSFLLGSQFEFTSFPSLRGFESYAIYSVPSAFILYLIFSVFGAFSEEVAYRGYVQTRISGRYGLAAGVIVSSLFFSLQHIHVFETSWLIQFFQMQLLHVFLGGVFGGYLFFKRGENIWSVFSMHALTNVFSVSAQIIVNHSYEYTFYVAEVVSFIAMFLLLWYLPVKKKIQ